jgi:hypothetical protein
MTVSNTFTIKEEVGITTTNYPIQIGRPFASGEISNYPQVLINGSAITTQSDVKTRWLNGSVKHAILSFYIPTLSANTTISCSFQNQTSGNNVGYESKVNMLSASYNFDAHMILTSASTISSSSRNMLSGDNYSYWTSGTIATTIIIVDHTSARSYDIGWDSNHSFRPIFHATFWPLINRVRVRYIGEIANSEKLQDMNYSLILTTGNTSVSAVYSKTLFNHNSMTRWTKEYWIGNTPSDISINHNLNYLASSMAVYNWDTSKVVSESKIANDYAGWLASNRDLYGSGLWDIAQPDTGARPDIAPYPGQYIRFLYTGDLRHQKIMFGQAQLSCAWPIHFRECNPLKKIQGTTNGLGKIISIRDRPTFLSGDLTYLYSIPPDNVTIVGTIASNTWIPDTAHHADTTSLPYMLTGDYYYLEELFFWASYTTAYPNGAAYDYTYGRGPTGAEGALPDAIQVRGCSWAFRTRCNAASLAPDSFIEKTYFTTLVDDAIAGWEAKLGISGTTYQGNAVYNWAYTHYIDPLGIPPLYQWNRGDQTFSQADYGINTSTTYDAGSLFEQHFMMVCLGRAKELGFPTENIIKYTSNFYINVLTNPSYNPYLVGNGRFPTTRVSDHQYFTTWAQLKTGYDLTNQTLTTFQFYDLDGGYDFLGMAATAQVSGVGSGNAWDFVSSRILPYSLLNDVPTWAIKTRWATDYISNGIKYHKTIRINF